MIKKHPETLTMKPVCKLISILAVVTLLGACDGGIKGTGGPMVDLDSASDPTILGTGPVEADGGPEGTVASIATQSDSQFTNNDNATLRSDAVVKIVHGANGVGPIVAFLNQNTSEPLLGLPGVAFGEGDEQYLPLVADSYELDLVEAGLFDSMQPELPTQLAGVYPLTLSAGSASTLILRGMFAEPAPADAVVEPEAGSQPLDATPDPALEPGIEPLDDESSYPLEVFSIPNSFSNTPGQSVSVQYRIIHAAPLFDQEGPLDIYINSTSSAGPTSGIPIFEDFDYADANTGYYETTPDGYWITATDADGQTQRLATLDPMTQTAGSAITIILLDDPDGVPGVDVNVLILNDGDRTGLEP